LPAGDTLLYRLPAITAILFYWITMKVVQQLTHLTLGRPNGPAYLTGELLNMALVAVWCLHFQFPWVVGAT